MVGSYCVEYRRDRGGTAGRGLASGDVNSELASERELSSRSVPGVDSVPNDYDLLCRRLQQFGQRRGHSNEQLRSDLE